MIFEPGDWVWVHLRKERFPNQQKSKLDSRGDGTFQVLERINENAYKVDIPGTYNMPATLNVADLSPFDMDVDSGTNLLEEGGADKHTSAHGMNKGIEHTGQITRARAKELKSGFISLASSLVDDLYIKLNEHNEGLREEELKAFFISMVGNKDVHA